MSREAIRRLALIILGTLGGPAGASLLIGLLTGSSSGRAVTLGFYLVGCLFLLAGFFLGNRGPARVRSEEETSGTGFLAVIFGGGGRQLRWGALHEEDGTIKQSAGDVGSRIEP